MRMQRRSTVVVSLVSVVLGGLVSAAVAAQTAATPTDPIPALLAEVRALRLAMEQSATVGPRIQVTLARLGIQEQRTSSLNAQLEEVRRRQAQAALDSQRMASQIEELERSLLTVTDKNAERQTHEQLAVLKRELATQATLEQQLRTRENDALQSLSTEQARWIELNARLDELERLLAPVSR